jgi:hypothetical protein
MIHGVVAAACCCCERLLRCRGRSIDESDDFDLFAAREQHDDDDDVQCVHITVQASRSETSVRRLSSRLLLNTT